MVGRLGLGQVGLPFQQFSLQGGLEVGQLVLVAAFALHLDDRGPLWSGCTLEHFCAKL